MDHKHIARVCVSVCEKDLGALRSACERAVEWADVIELRLDCFEELPKNLSDTTQKLSCPLILTFRPAEQGGHRNLTREERQSFWTSLAPRDESIWWDVEGDLVNDLSPDWSRVIVSHHDFSAVPNDLEQIYERLAHTPAAVIKIAVQANDIVDCHSRLSTSRSRARGRKRNHRDRDGQRGNRDARAWSITWLISNLRRSGR